MEKIRSAAIIHDGLTFEGRRHGEIMRDIVDSTGATKVIGQQGFVTNLGRFVDRKEAATIAISSGQIEELRFSKTELFSEDLW